MVMETMEAPSPQCVGLEFVRQYYTVLNKAPIHLHRFYSEKSLFMHGVPSGTSDPTVGQADIHKKILSLNFHDCHAKIRMVDAHATLDNGVVIQVIGELSNNGLPMRKFMQTFVLAPQTPKKYYVHNDIFRYQDEVFSDEEIVEDGNSEAEEELETQKTTIVENTAYPANSSRINGTSHHIHNREPEPTPPILPPTTLPSTISPSPARQQQQSQATPTSNNATPVTPSVQIPVSLATTPTPAIVNEPSRPTTPPTAETDGWGTPRGSPDEWDDPMEESLAKTPTKKENKPQSSLSQNENTVTQPSPPAPSTQQISNEPKTFANLFKNTSSNSFSQSTGLPIQPSSSQMHHESPPTNLQQQSYSTPPSRVIEPSNSLRGSTSGPSPGRDSSGPGGGSARMPRSYHEEDKRRPAVPDSQQVFVGNLPHSIGEDQLRTEFNQYGRIIEVRINTGKGKAGAKGPGGHQVPNFGFIAFEDEAAVAKCLSARPIYLNGESRINVEEKKARSRIDSSGGGMGGGGRPSSGRPSLGGSGGGMRMQGSGMQGVRESRGGGRGGFSRESRGGSHPRGGGGFMPRR